MLNDGVPLGPQISECFRKFGLQVAESQLWIAVFDAREKEVCVPLRGCTQTRPHSEANDARDQQAELVRSVVRGDEVPDAAFTPFCHEEELRQVGLSMGIIGGVVTLLALRDGCGVCADAKDDSCRDGLRLISRECSTEPDCNKESLTSRANGTANQPLSGREWG